MTAGAPLIAVCVPVFNRLPSTRQFVEAIRRQTYSNRLLVICDDASTDGTREFLAQQPDVVMVPGSGSLWWSGGTNASIREALKRGADAILTINDDSEIAPDYLEKLARASMACRGDVVATTIVQWQAPDRVWSLGASYIRREGTTFINDCCGAPLMHLRTLCRQMVELDTMPGNGVLYPSEVFARVGFFDEVWTPQYHGDTVFAHRARRSGFRLMASLDVTLGNDMEHHLEAKQFDPLQSLRSAFFGPALYKAVEEREGEEVALDFLGDLLCRVRTDWCPGVGAIFGKVRERALQPQWHFDPHIAHCISAGQFVLLGYQASAQLLVRRDFTPWHFKYDIEGAGILTLALRVMRDCEVRMALFTSEPVDHAGLLIDCLGSGVARVEQEWVCWFDFTLRAGEVVNVPVALISRKVKWQGIYLTAASNASSGHLEGAS